MAKSDPPLASGARVLVRDAEWLVRSVDSTSSGGQAVQCVGISELVKDREAIFLTELDRDIKVLDPADTKLVPDDSGGYRGTRLYIESLLRQSPPTDAPTEEKLYIGQHAAMDMVSYQLDPALMALRQPRQRILIADAVGLGKTLEAGILLSEMMRRGRAKRILVVALKSMLTQFQKELWSRFSIPLVRLDSTGIRRVRQEIPSTHNPFHYFDKAIISIDTLKQDREYGPYIENAYWDVIVIDEAHNVAERSTNSMRSRLARLLASRSDALIMLSATPHDGSARSFASLMTMLNPTAIANPDEYGPDDIDGLYIRRFKKDIKHLVTSAFQDRRIFQTRAPSNPPEDAAFEQLAELSFARLDKQKGASRLFKTTLEKALFSSPAACIESIRNRIKRLESEDSDDARHDTAELQSLATCLKRIGPESFSKYQKLLSILNGDEGTLQWNPGDPTDRLVIFTERIETLRFLQSQLTTDLKLKKGQVEILHGTLSDVDQQRVVEDFGKEDAPVRLLIASDIAAEGINLHYLSHRLIHFDIPWSLMVFQQRNGRVDRYGQERQPEIYYLLTESSHEKIRGDLRILEILIHKDDQAHQNIGDPSAFMKVYDIDKEEGMTADAIERGLSAEDFDSSLDANLDDDPLAILMGTDEPTVTTDAGACLASMPTLYLDDYNYVKDGIELLKATTTIQVAVDDEERFVNLTVPETMRIRLRDLPREVMDPVADENEFTLTTDRDRIKHEIARCRKEENAWPRFHLLWDLHPVFQWLNDSLQTTFGRHQAPVVTLTNGSLKPGETIFLATGVIPNRRSHPLIHRWLGLQFTGDTCGDIFDDIPALFDRLGLTRGVTPNPGRDVKTGPLQRLLPKVVRETEGWLSIHRDEFNSRVQPELKAQLDRLERLRKRRLQQLELDFSDVSDGARIARSRKEAKEREIEKLFGEYQDWIRETMTTEDKPYIRIVAVFRGDDA